MGTAHRPAGGGDLLRLLGRQHSAGGGAVEWRHQLRRGGRLYLRRPDHPPDPEHLSQVLQAKDGRLPFRYLLRGHGGGGADRRSDLRQSCSHPLGAPGAGRRGLHRLEYTTWLNLAFLILAGLLISFPQNRRPGDAAHDEQASGPRKHPSSCCLETCDRGAAGSAAPEVIACRALTGARGTSAPKDHVHAGCESSAAQEGHERDPAEILSLRQLRQLAHHEFKIVRHFIAKSAFFPPGTWEPSRRTLSMPTAMP